MDDFEIKSNDEFFKTNFQEIMTELLRLLKYISRMERAPDTIIPKIENSLETFNKILSDSRRILEEIADKKQQVMDFLQNSQNYKDSIQAYETLKQAYKQKFKDQENKILTLQQESLNYQRINNELSDNLKEKDLILETLRKNSENTEENLEKMETERENLRKQLNNYQSLTKQMNLERLISNNNANINNNNFNTKEIEMRIMEVREELLRTKEEYCNRLRIKDQTIEQMQRKIDRLEKESSLNEDWLSMQESLNEKASKKPKKTKGK